MQVDNSNFYQAYSLIHSLDLFQKSHTISLDLEFTGLKLDNNDKQRHEEFLFERYDKMKHIAIKYSIIQVGLCFFVDGVEGIEAYPFNFYVYPRSYKNVNPVVTMQCTTTDFNSRNGMDWNRWIKQGITYIQMAKMEDAMYVAEKMPLEDLEKKLIPEQAEEIEQITAQLKNFQKEDNDTLQIEASSTFVRLVVERTLEKCFKTMYLQPYNADSSLKEKLLLFIRKVNTDDRDQISKRVVLDICGFTKIFERIWKSKAKVVGHNSFLDLLYLYQSFVGDLPVSYFAFKRQINKGFPCFYDTKYLSSVPKYKNVFTNTSLQELQLSILEKPSMLKKVNIKLGKGFELYDWNNASNKKSFHEAGYDAYLTGWVFHHLVEGMDYHPHESKLRMIRSMFDMNLKQEKDQWTDEIKDTFTLIFAIRKPKDQVVKLFDYKKLKMQGIIDNFKQLPSKTSLLKEEIRYKESRLDYLIVELKNLAKKETFVKAMQGLKTEEVDLISVQSFLQEKRMALEKPKGM